MSFLLDTNILSAYLKHSRKVAHRFVQHSGGLYTSSVALGELYTWAFRVPTPSARLSAIDVMIRDDISSMQFDDECARRFGWEKNNLRRRGIGISPVDLQIACVALVYDLTLVTNNTADFVNISGLRIEDWLTP